VPLRISAFSSEIVGSGISPPNLLGIPRGNFIIVGNDGFNLVAHHNNRKRPGEPERLSNQLP
jgi:hypothetical protein